VRKAFAVLHQALEAQASQIEALSLEVRKLRKDNNAKKPAPAPASFPTPGGEAALLEQRIEVIERLLERRTHDEIYTLERQEMASKEVHHRLAALEAAAARVDDEQRAPGACVDDKLNVNKVRQIAAEVVAQHEVRTYSMVGEGKMNLLEERVGVVEEGLRTRPTTAEVTGGFDEVFAELKTKANALSVEREVNAMSTRWEQLETAASALEQNVEAELNGVFEETKLVCDAVKKNQLKNTTWLSKLEASQRDLVSLAESQAERIKHSTYFREEALVGLRQEVESIRSVVDAVRRGV
jgi:hypothetical protein